jgi:multiple sugar transport system permease protein
VTRGEGAGAPRRAARLFENETAFALLMVAPALVILLLTTTFPLGYLFWNSFHSINLAMPYLNGFVGLANYASMLHDGEFWHALALTAIYTASTVTLQIVIGLGLALMVMQIPAGQWLFRVVAILPIVLAPVVVGLFWRTLMLAPNFGIVDFAAKALGLGAINWLGSPIPALVSVIVIHTWQWTPFAFLVLLASLASLPPDVYEAARIDRAGAFQRFIHITLPLIRPAIVIVVIMRAMIALSAFAAIFAATGGGPGTATEILNLYAYRTSFVKLDFGYGSALAVALLLITLIVSSVLFVMRTARVR